MRKPLHLIIPLALLLLFSFSPNETEDADRIIWSADRPLQWTDFTGAIDSKSSYDAWTYSGMSYTYTWNYSGDDINVEVNIDSWFEKDQSWVKKSKMSPALLAHEQLHFDIAELHSRYLEEAINNFEYTENVEAEVDSIYNAIFNQLLAAQIKYDEESEHYQNKSGQLKWNTFVRDELKRLE